MIRQATTSNKSMLELLEGLPPSERKKLMRLVNSLSSASKTAGARAAFVSVAPPEQSAPDQDIIRSPEEQEPIQ